MKFGEILKEIRKENKDSLRKLSEKSNIGHSYIDRIEKGQLEPSENVLKGLFKAYPTYKRKLSKAFIKEKIPAFVFNEIEEDEITEDSLDRILILLELLEKDEKKLILNNIVEKVELKAYQNGTLETIKSLLDEIKEKIEEL